MKNSYKIVLVLASGLGVAAIAVLVSVFYRVPSTEGTSANQSTREFSLSESPQSLESADPNQETADSGASPNSRALIDIVKLPNEFAKTAALYEILVDADESQVLRMLDESKSIEPIGPRHAVQHVIFTRYATINPVNALTHLNEMSIQTQNRMVRPIFSVWARSNLNSAIEYAKTMPRQQKIIVLQSILLERTDLTYLQRVNLDKQLELTHEGIFWSLNSVERGQIEDPREEWYALMENTDQSSKSDWLYLIGFAKSWIQAEGAEAVRTISESIPHNSQGFLVLSNAFIQLAESQPEEAFNLASSLTDQHYMNGITISVALTWARSAPLNALDALSALDNRHRRYTVEERILEQWAATSPRELLEKIDSIPTYLRERGLQKAAISIANTSIHDALALLSDFRNEDSLSETTRSIISTWSWDDPQAAWEWVMSDTGNPDHGILFETVLENTAWQDPKRALTLALRSAKATGRYWLVSQTMNAIYRYHREIAEELLDDVPKELRLHAKFGIAEDLVTIDTRKLMQLTSSESEAGEAYILNGILISTWANENPRDLLENLDQFRSRIVQNRAALNLLMKYYSDPHFTLTNTEINSIHNILFGNRDTVASFEREASILTLD